MPEIEFDFTKGDRRVKKDVAWAIEQLLLSIQPHEQHSWKQVGRCVWCEPCGVRLYQGTIPKEKKRA